MSKCVEKVFDEDDRAIPCGSPAICMVDGEHYCECHAPKQESLTFERLREANVERCNNYFNHKIDSWSGAEWGNAMAGEHGEVATELADMMSLILKFMSTLKSCDTLKKALRQMEGDPYFKDIKSSLGLELADVVTYADLIAARFGIDLGEEVRRKFNIVSDKRGSPLRL